MALGARQARRSNRHSLAKAAKGAGTLGAGMGRLASEIHQARESGNGKHRSPVEVVLEGLTARGSRR
jgi:X-X-X-Leu-X-X-Gly heptad repeat protein